MTATGAEQVGFVRSLGMPLTSAFRRTFTEVEAPTRLAYLSLIDFVPDQEPYQHLTVVDIEPAGDRTNVVMTIDPLHDDAWTLDYCAHRDDELANLEAAIRQHPPVIAHRRDGRRRDRGAYVGCISSGVVSAEATRSLSAAKASCRGDAARRGR